MRYFDWDKDPAVLLDSGETFVLDPFTGEVSEGDTDGLVRDFAAPELPSREAFLERFPLKGPLLLDWISLRQSGDATATAAL
jgi:hypothetical protein